MARNTEAPATPVLPSVVKSISKTIGTEPNAVTYDVSFRQFADYAEIRAVYADEFEETVLDIVNAAQKQGATQGGTEGIRKALAMPATTPEEVEAREKALEDAVTAHQKVSLAYVRGKGGENRGGPIKAKDAAALGKEIAKRAAAGTAISAEDLAELLKSHGVALPQ